MTDLTVKPSLSPLLGFLVSNRHTRFRADNRIKAWNWASRRRLSVSEGRYIYRERERERECVLQREMEGGGGGRRITASPRPCSGRRVVADKRRRTWAGADGFVNSVKKLQRREISSKRDRAFTMTDSQERFRNIRLQVSLIISVFNFWFLFSSLIASFYALSWFGYYL